ncbi:hypothetical protein C8R47DRAFT_1319727 [Mycena vitilis]|nr:hypothetical protein C8R47DRAFT_1319727 [Mycena vitilis]
MPLFPLRTDKPHFDEASPLLLRRYFEDVDELCHRCSDKPTSALKIERALYYTSDPATVEGIMRLYPGSDGGYSSTQLDEFLARAAKKRWGSEQDIAKYHREFNKIANRLVADGQLSSSSLYFQYRKGIPPELLQTIEVSMIGFKNDRYTIEDEVTLNP